MIQRCVIICGSPDTKPQLLQQEINNDDFIICADSGYTYALKAGIKPDLFVGDFDSFEGALPEDIPRITLKTHKDDTDSMHCAAVALDRGYKEVLLVGATGGRLDHTIANLSVLQYLTENGVNAVILNGNEYICFINDGAYEYTDINGKTFSVFPFGCESIEVTYIGKVEYPAENLKITNSKAVGISNIFRSDRVKIILKGKAILIIQRKIL